MKKWLIIIAAVVGIAVAAGWFFQDTLRFMLMATALKPGQDFASDTRHPAPDYSQTSTWAALPFTPDNADVVPDGATPDNQTLAEVDVFFIHPTTYFNSDHWNAPLDDVDANTFTDEQVLRNQASAFNNCCRVYAPRYRQATLFAFMDDAGNGEQAIDLAYQDIKAAFDWFINNYSEDRPFILAGHSQGAEHINRLLRDVVAPSNLLGRMVAAYPIGYFLDGSNGVPICQSAEHIGCQATWNTVGTNATPFRDTTNDICVNPLNWSARGDYASFENNTGAILFSDDTAQLLTGVTDAQCIEGQLVVTEVRSDAYTNEMFGPGNYHFYDYNFFWTNIRENATLRVEAFFSP